MLKPIYFFGRADTGNLGDGLAEPGRRTGGHRASGQADQRTGRRAGGRVGGQADGPAGGSVAWQTVDGRAGRQRPGGEA